MASYHWEFAIQGKLETKEKIDIIVKQRKSGMWKWNKEKERWDSEIVKQRKKGWYSETKEKSGDLLKQKEKRGDILKQRKRGLIYWNKGKEWWADMKFTITSGSGRHLSLVVAAAHSWAGIIPTHFNQSSSLQGALPRQKNGLFWDIQCICDAPDDTDWYLDA